MEGPEEDTEDRQEVRPSNTSLRDTEYNRTDMNSEIPSTSYHPNRAEYGLTEDEPVGEDRKHLAVPAVRQADGRFRCDMCDKEYGNHGSLTKHKQVQHKGVRYGCDLCDHIATQKGNLTTHKQSQHEGVRYGCDQCDYKATEKGHLTKHKQVQHEGVRYDCDQCDYKATTTSHLTKHKRRIHHKESLTIV
jgi:hypothetical protein